MPTVFIPSQLRDITAGKSTVIVDGTTVREIISSLEVQFPGIADRLCQAGELNPSLQISVNDSISTRGLQTSVTPNSEVHFIPAIGGG